MITDSIIRALELFASVLPFTVAGIVLASLAIELKIFNRLFPVVKPIMRLAHFSPESGLAFMIAFGSPIAAVAMIGEFYSEKKVDRREALIATIATWFPHSIFDGFVYIAPVIIPLLGVLGITYVLLFVFNGVIVTMLMLIIGRVLLTEKKHEFVMDNDKVPLKTALKASIKSSTRLLKQFIVIALPVSIIAFILIDMGIFDGLPQQLDWIPLPPESLTIIPLQIANPMASYIMLADLMNTGLLDFKLALLTLLIAGVFVGFRYIFAHSLPYYSGIFGPILGTRIILISAVLQLGLTVLMIVVLALFL